MQMILASLCLRTSKATSFCQQSPARMCWCLLAVMATPLRFAKQYAKTAFAAFYA
jgi:hypothetical protein